MEKNHNLCVLDEIHKGAKMGMDSLSYLSEKVSEPNLKDNLNFQYHQYSDTIDHVNEIYKRYGGIPEDTNLMNQTMLWTGIQLNTISDKSNSHIADILIQGTNMGIVEGRKLLNQNQNLDPEVNQVLHTFVEMQENTIEKLKTFL